MKTTRLLLLLLASATSIYADVARSQPAWAWSQRAGIQIGYDDNVRFTGLNATGATWTTASFSASAKSGSPEAAEGTGTQFAYSLDASWYEAANLENHVDHRLVTTAARHWGDWRVTLRSDEKWIDGATDTALADGSANAFAVAYIRERREQFQHRLKTDAVRELGRAQLHLSAEVLAYDYQTTFATGCLGYADRADLHANAAWTWRTETGTRWSGAVTQGQQAQAKIPLSGGEFDYDSRYTRAVLGFEHRWSTATHAHLQIGPEWRHFTGHVNPTAMPDRDHQSLWLDGTLTTSLAENLSWTAHVARWIWLSGTGKSAYTDSSIDTAIALKVSPQLTVRAVAKAQILDYLPAARDDRLYAAGTSLTWRPSARWEFGVEVLNQHGGNGLTNVSGRTYDRTVVSTRLSAQF